MLQARFAELVHGAQTGHVDRLLLARDVWSMVLAHPWTGVGRGAFALAFPAYSSLGGRMQFAFAENEYLQLLADFGLLGAALVCAAAAVAVWRTVRGVRSPVRIAATIGLGALALHGAVDFSWETGGVAVAAMAVAALAAPPRGLGRVPLPAAIGGALVTLALVALATSGLGRTSEEDADSAAAALSARRPAAEVVALVTAAIQRHPSDGYLADLAAAALIRARDPASLGWLERALILRPNDPIAHALTARVLAFGGAKSQAAGELALAFAGDPASYLEPLSVQALDVFPDDRDATLLASALPTVDVAHAVGARLGAAGRWPALAVIARRGLDLDPNDVTLHRYLTRAALEQR